MVISGGQVGNDNAKRGRVWRDAINRALETRGLGDRKAALDALAEKLLQKCDEGDVAALREFGDRAEEKAEQAVTIANPDGETFRTLNEIREVIVDPRNPGT